MDEDDDIAIDFLQLMREEKRRARQSRRQASQEDKQQESKPKDDDDAPVESTTKDGDGLDSWPLDWLSNPPLSRLDPVSCISKDPGTIYYKTDFLNQERRDSLLAWLQGLPDADDSEHVGKWSTMKYGKRRVALFDDAVHPLPLPLRQLAKALVDVGVFDSRYEPNHVLVNEYTANQGILPHTDGPLYHAKTATISIGANALMHFTRRLTSDQIGQTYNPNVMQVLLEGQGSLVVFSESAYTDHCHGIDDQVSIEYATSKCVNAAERTPVSRGYRVSLTFRHKLPQPT